MPKTLYLTIDDAPSLDCVNKLNYLDDHNIKAIWFCEGRFIRERFEVAVDMVKRGHMIGNHAYSHPHFSDLSLTDWREEIIQTHLLVRQVYESAGRDWDKRYFRFPYGDKGNDQNKDAIQDFLRQRGYVQPKWRRMTYQHFIKAGYLDDVDCYWTYDSLDWSPYSDHPDHDIDSPEKVLARIDEDVPAGGRGINYTGSSDIVLVHDHVTPDNLFQQIIDKLLTKNVRFKLPA